MADLARAEHECFAIIRREIERCFAVLRHHELGDAQVREAPIDAAIADHPFYSNPTYTRTDGQPMLAAAETYANRCNLLVEDGWGSVEWRRYSARPEWSHRRGASLHPATGRGPDGFWTRRV